MFTTLFRCLGGCLALVLLGGGLTACTRYNPGTGQSEVDYGATAGVAGAALGAAALGVALSNDDDDRYYYGGPGYYGGGYRGGYRGHTYRQNNYKKVNNVYVNNRQYRGNRNKQFQANRNNWNRGAQVRNRPGGGKQDFGGSRPRGGQGRRNR